MSKPIRQRAILQVLKQGSIADQDELRRALARQGLKVTQATLSRDIHELGLVKSGEGYSLPETAHPEPALPSASRLVREFVTSVREAQNLVVVKTSVGSAQPVAAALDAEAWPESVGTIAGDDSILIVSSNKRSAHALAQQIREMLA